MDAIVTAGGIPLPEEPLYPATQGQSKALVDVAGKPMIQWVLDALSEAKTVDNVIIVGLTEKSGLECSKKMYFVSNQGKMVDNLQAGARKVQGDQPESRACADGLIGYSGHHRRNGGLGGKYRHADRPGCVLPYHPARGDGKALSRAANGPGRTSRAWKYAGET